VSIFTGIVPFFIPSRWKKLSEPYHTREEPNENVSLCPWFKNKLYLTNFFEKDFLILASNIYIIK
jgi:hypothetical protein